MRNINITMPEHRAFPVVAILSAVSLISPVSYAQLSLPPADPTATAAPTAEAASTAAPAVSEPDQTGRDGSEARIEALEKKMAEQEAAFNARLDHMQEQQNALEIASVKTDFEPSLKVFGFFDLTFNKLWAGENSEGELSFFDGMVNENPTFFMQNLNLYFKSEMTETLSAMIELRFSFAPLGEIQSFEIEGISDFDRIDTTVSDQYTSERIRLHSVILERIHLTWKPKDWFGVIAGRFLTPYGIWNIDHGSPVIIAVRPPFSQVSHFLPLAQTGLQVFGTIPLGQRSMFDYAVTFSNGRGPMDEVYDLDANKAGGLRLHFGTTAGKAKMSIGGYGYIGDYTNKIQVATISPAFNGQWQTDEEYTEYTGAIDAKIEVAGVTLQAEYVRRLMKYSVRPYIEPGSGGMQTQTGYPADNIAQDAYLLLAYTLPFKGAMANMPLTPYYMEEYTDLNDTLDSGYGWSSVFGLNFKPSPFVTLKAETYCVFFPDFHDNAVAAGTRKSAMDSFWGISGQMAVSF